MPTRLASTRAASAVIFKRWRENDRANAWAIEIAPRFFEPGRDELYPPDEPAGQVPAPWPTAARAERSKTENVVGAIAREDRHGPVPTGRR